MNVPSPPDDPAPNLPAPNLRGPSLRSVIGAAIGGFFIPLDGCSRESCNRYCTTSADCPDGLPCVTFTQECTGGTRTLGRCEFAP